MKSLKEKSGNDKIFLKIADLASMSSVRKVAETITAEESRLDILINNAAMSGEIHVVGSCFLFLPFSVHSCTCIYSIWHAPFNHVFFSFDISKYM